MTLDEYVRQSGKGGLSALVRKTGLHWVTVKAAVARSRSTTVETARVLSEATGGAVTAASILGVEHADTVAPAPATQESGR